MKNLLILLWINIKYMFYISLYNDKMIEYDASVVRGHRCIDSTVNFMYSNFDVDGLDYSHRRFIYDPTEYPTPEYLDFEEFKYLSLIKLDKARKSYKTFKNLLNLIIDTIVLDFENVKDFENNLIYVNDLYTKREKHEIYQLLDLLFNKNELGIESPFTSGYLYLYLFGDPSNIKHIATVYGFPVEEKVETNESFVKRVKYIKHRLENYLK